MNADRYALIREVFLAVAPIAPEARARALDERCASDAELRREVEALLRSDERAGAFLDTPALGHDFAIPVAPDEPPPVDALPRRIGRFAILSRLGEGGMGVVYEARQDQPDRRVALKVLRHALATESTRRRFQHEVAALARLHHPAIAQIYDADITATARGDLPYFAMELVEGRPITDHADAHELPLHARVALLADIADAIHHAHTNGVIHRDLKPSNILVTTSGARPKVLDFGVARITDADPSDTTMHTRSGQLVGTVAYMSPEQVGGHPGDVDARSDVYALGVLAFQLLTGRLPYDTDDHNIARTVRTIAETEPITASSIAPALRGDLDTILRKALEKDRVRRYQSASDLRDDLRRFLRDQPIAARPPSAIYQLRKFARRNTALVAAMAIVFLTLIAATIISIVAFANAAAERREAVQAGDDLEAVADFLASTISTIDPQRMGEGLRGILGEANAGGRFHPDGPGAINPTDAARTLIDEQILTPAASSIGARFAAQPLVEARLRQTLSDTYRDIGLLDKAEPQLLRAVELRKAHLPRGHPDTLWSTTSLGVLYQHTGRYEAAERVYREDLAIRTRTLGPDHPHTLTTRSNLGSALFFLGRADEAIPHLRVAAEGLRDCDEVERSLLALNNLGTVLDRAGRHDEAAPILHEIRGRALRAFGPEDYRTLIATQNLALLLRSLGRTEEAIPLFRTALEGARTVHGNNHPRTISAIANMAGALAEAGEGPRAEALFLEAINRAEMTLSEAHPQRARVIGDLVAFYERTGDAEAAERWRRALAPPAAAD